MIIRVLVADDHKLFRQGLISLMHTRDDLVEVVGEAQTGAEAVQLAERLRPDVILMDIYMPEMNGLIATREIKERFPNIAVIMLTSSEADEHLFEAVSYGAAGYLLKSLDADELFELLIGVIRGEAAITKSMASKLMRGIVKRSTEKDPLHEELTERETMVLRLIAKGATNSEIGEELHISVNTVKSHLKSILSKLQLENRTQVAAYAVQTGLIPDARSSSKS